MVIYQILNTTNGKSYVGQAKGGFYRRYEGRYWWKHVRNGHLKNAIALYGKDAFEVRILERDVSSEDELNRLEREHIARIGCIHPDGYNYQSGGQSQVNRGHHRESRDKMAISLSGGKVHRLLNNRTGVIHEFVNIQRFADEHDLSGPMLSVILSGKKSRKSDRPYYAQHREWSLPERPIRRVLCVSPTGEEQIVMDGVDGGIKGLCKRVGMCSATVFKAIQGIYAQAAGWTFKILPPCLPPTQ